MRELLVPVFLNGECVYESPKVMDIQKYCKKELDTLWDESKRLVNPHTVHVDLSNELWQTKQKLLDSYHKKIIRLCSANASLAHLRCTGWHKTGRLLSQAANFI